MLRMTFFSIFTSCDSFLARSGPKAPAVLLRKAWPAEPHDKFKLAWDSVRRLVVTSEAHSREIRLNVAADIMSS